MSRLGSFVAGLVVGAVGAIALLFRLLGDTEQGVAIDLEELARPESWAAMHPPPVRTIPSWRTISTRQLTELVEDGYGPGGFYDRAIRDGLGMPPRSLEELKAARAQLLEMGVPESALEALDDPSLS